MNTFLHIKKLKTLRDTSYSEVSLRVLKGFINTIKKVIFDLNQIQ